MVHVRLLRRLGLLLALAMFLVACPADEPDVAVDEPDDVDVEVPDDDVDEPVVEDEETFTITFASHVSPETAEMEIVQWYMRRVEELTDNRVTFDEHYLGALVGGPDIFPAIQDGRTEAGFHVSFYQPAELPLVQVAGVPFVTEDSEAYVRALSSMFEEHEAFGEDFLQHGVRPLFFIHLSSATIGLTEPVESIDGLTGQRIRSAGLLAPVLEAAGAEPVAVAAGEIYEALQRGVLDGWSSLALSPAATFGLHEVAPYIHHPGTGMYLAPSYMISEDVWNGLPGDIQAAFEQASEEVIMAGTQITMDVDAGICERVLAEGAEVIVWSDAERDRWAEEVGDAAVDLWVSSVVDAGALSEEEARAFVDQLRSKVQEFEAESGYEDGLRRCAAQS
jgi:TRAP-type transport system periplasmic protein